MIGTGYVGLVSGVCFSDLGNKVICVDKDIDKIKNLKKGIVPIYEPGLEEILKRNYKKKRLLFTNNLKKAVIDSDLIFICVGTPTKNRSNSADLKHVFEVVNELKKNILKYKVIITKSTVPVTTGDKIEKILGKLKRKKLIDIVSNPEFLREGEAIGDFSNPDRVIIGTDSKRANKLLKTLYMPIIKKSSRYFKTSRRGAELIKYASNAFLATKISYINELSNLCEKAEVDIKDISAGMGLDQRIGGRFLRAGPAYGGSCFPKDTKAITSTADKFKTNLSVIKSVIKSNENRSKLLLKRVYGALNNRIKNKKISFLGVTFKANTDDMRDSSSLTMIPELSKRGANISYYDPTGIKKEFNKLKNVNFAKSISICLEKADLIIIHTEWNDFKSLDFKKINKNKKTTIFDMRNLYLPEKMIKKKIKYFSVGRGT